MFQLSLIIAIGLLISPYLIKGAIIEGNKRSIEDELTYLNKCEVIKVENLLPNDKGAEAIDFVKTARFAVKKASTGGLCGQVTVETRPGLVPGSAFPYSVRDCYNGSMLQSWNFSTNFSERNISNRTITRIYVSTCFQISEGKMLDRYCFKAETPSTLANLYKYKLNDQLKFSFENFDLDLDETKCQYSIDPKTQQDDENFTFQLVPQSINPLKAINPDFTLLIKIKITLTCQSKEICGSENFMQESAIIWNESKNSGKFSSLTEGATFKLTWQENRYLYNSSRECPSSILSEYPTLSYKSVHHFCPELYYTVPVTPKGTESEERGERNGEETSRRTSIKWQNRMKCLTPEYAVHLNTKEGFTAREKIKTTRAYIHYSGSLHYLITGLEFKDKSEYDMGKGIKPSYSLLDCYTKEKQIGGIEFIESGYVHSLLTDFNSSLSSFIDRYCYVVNLPTGTMKFSIEIFDVYDIQRCYYKLEIIIDGGLVEYRLKKAQNLPYSPPGFEVAVEFTILAECLNKECDCEPQEMTILCRQEECAGHFMNLTEGIEYEFVTKEKHFVYNATRTCPASILSEFPVLEFSHQSYNCWKSGAVRIPFKHPSSQLDNICFVRNSLNIIR